MCTCLTFSDFKFKLTKGFSFGELAFGVDGYFASHDSVITNPNNMMFKVVNFNKVEDNRYGIFSQWQNQFDQTNVQLGVRFKRAEADAGEEGVEHTEVFSQLRQRLKAKLN